MVIATGAGNAHKLRRSGKEAPPNAPNIYMPLLRSLFQAKTDSTIDMALLTELARTEADAIATP